MSEPIVIKNRGVLGLVALAVMAAVTVLALGLWRLSAERADLPAVVAIDKAKLADALMDAPWISSEQQYAESDEDATRPVLWYVTAPGCAACRAFETGAMTKLMDRGVDVRVIVFVPRDAAARAGDDIAPIVKGRDWTGLQLWMQGKHTSGETLDPYEQEGVIEWTRQAGERIAALMARNDMRFAAPMLFWQRGEEWRASGNVGAALSEIDRDLAPKA